MSNLLQTATKSLLVICLAFGMAGCGVKKGGKDAQCDTEGKKITSALPPDPNAPYEVAKAPGAQKLTIAAYKETLKNASGSKLQDGAVGALRASSLRETALSLGARGGLAERAQYINGILLNYEPLLAKIFNFYGLLLDNDILPPVLIEGRNTLNLTGNDAIRIADRNYKILAQARFVTAPPTWREYLWMNFDVPEMPDRSLLPRSKPERIMWERDLEEGWQAGLKQGDLIYTENINRLVRDYKGMIMYRHLLAQNIVSPPYVASLDMGITGNGQDMTINDRVLRITAFPALQSDGEGWKTEIHTYE
jgi:defect-in-organelle-trafficking protein DotC